MVKTKKALAIVLAVSIVLVLFAGCGAGKEKTESPSANNSKPAKINASLKAEKIGTVKHDKASFYKGGVIYQEGDMLGVTSFDGSSDTGAVFAACNSEGNYFVVSKKLAENENDFEGLNSDALIDSSGNVILDYSYAAFEVLNERFAVAFSVTERTDSKDEALVYISSKSSIITPIAPQDDDFLYKGEWKIFDLTTGKEVPGAKGTNAYVKSAKGNFVTFIDDADNRVTVNYKGEPAPEQATLFSNGSYLLAEGNEYVCYDTDGKELFKVGNTDYRPWSYENGYYSASKTVNNETVYALMDETGKILSEGYGKTPYVYGSLITVDEKVYTLDGKPFSDKEVQGIVVDEVFGNGYILRYDDDCYVFVDNDGKVIAEFKENDDINVYTSDFAVSNKKDNDYYYYSFKDKDYTIDGHSTRNWIVSVDEADDTESVICTLDNSKLIKGYSTYNMFVSGDNNLYVFAVNADGTKDVYQIIK